MVYILEQQEVRNCKIPQESYQPSNKTKIEKCQSISGRESLTREEAALRIQALYRGYHVRQRLKEHIEEFRKIKLEKKKNFYNADKKNITKRRSDAIKDVRDMFTPSKNNFAREHMNDFSSSALSPCPKCYLTENSLFSWDRETVLVFGGIDPHTSYGVGRNTGKDVYRYLPDGNLWEYVTDMPEPRHHHSVAFFKGRVFLVGGVDPREDDLRRKDVVCNTTWSFEPCRRCWFREGSLLTGRKHFGLIVSNQSLYVIGGQDKLGNILNSVEKFNAAVSYWEYEQPMKYSRTGLACVKYRNYIWAAGGLTANQSDQICDVVESYDLTTCQWTQITPLLFPRCHARMLVMSDRLYLIGGAGRILNNQKSAISVPTIDVWNSKIVEWNHVNDLTIPRHGHAVTHLGTQILIIGGVTTIYMRALSNTECYCTQRGTWIRGLASLPTPLSGHAVVTLPPVVLMNC